jgi:hypothetical protein
MGGSFFIILNKESHVWRAFWPAFCITRGHLAYRYRLEKGRELGVCWLVVGFWVTYPSPSFSPNTKKP